jgi:hypothetical protein
METLLKLTPKQLSNAKVCFAALSGIMERDLWEGSINKRSCTRQFYEGCGRITSGWMSDAANMLTAKNRTADHFISPQTYAYYILDNWDRYSKWENFLPQWILCSQTIAVTAEENTMLKGFTMNTAETGNVIKVKTPILNRYSELGINLYHEQKGVVMAGDKFPFEVPDHFIEYEKENLLI